MKLTGSIPEKLLIIAKPSIKVGLEWDDLDEEYKTEYSEVRPAFVSDATNEKTIETGRTWARGPYYYGQQSKGKIDEIEVPNTPKSGYRVISLEKRSEGGRAWKVVSPDGYWFDLREDVLLDTMVEEGVKKGVLQGKFIWARVRSEMKLVRVGSKLHEAMVAATSRGKESKISNKDLVPGTVYETKGGQESTFLGWVDTIRFRHERDFKKRGIWPSPPYETTREVLKNVMCWYNGDLFTDKKYFGHEVGNLFSYQFKKSHTAIRVVSSNSKFALDGWILKLQKRVEKEYVEWRERISQPPYGKIPPDDDLRQRCWHSELLMMTPQGVDLNIHPTLKDADQRAKTLK